MNREVAPLVAGIAMIAFAVCVVVFVAGRADFGGSDPFERAEVAAYLSNIEEGATATRVAFGFAIAIDALLVLLVAATTYSVIAIVVTGLPLWLLPASSPTQRSPA